MSGRIGEELAYIQSKAYAEGLKTLGKGAIWILQKLFERAAKKNENLKGGKCNLKELMNSKKAITQIKVEEKHLKDLVKEGKRYSAPVAVLKTINNEHKVFFKAEDTEIINSIMQDLIIKQLKENTKEIQGITITRSNTEDKISFKNAEGKEFIGSAKDKQETVKGLQDELGLEPRKALEVYIEATRVEAREIDVTKSKRKDKIQFKDGSGREFTGNLSSKKETVVGELKKTFGLDDKAANRLYEKATKQTVKSKIKDINSRQKGMQQNKEPKSKTKDRGDR